MSEVNNTKVKRQKKRLSKSARTTVLKKLEKTNQTTKA